LICEGVVYGLVQLFVVMGYPTAITRGGPVDLGNKKLEWLSRGVMSRFGLRGSHMPLSAKTFFMYRMSHFINYATYIWVLKTIYNKFMVICIYDVESEYSEKL
jgi:hypothetical protein